MSKKIVVTIGDVERLLPIETSVPLHRMLAEVQQAEREAIMHLCASIKAIAKDPGMADALCKVILCWQAAPPASISAALQALLKEWHHESQRIRASLHRRTRE